MASNHTSETFKRIVLIGTTGVGKSTFGNAILGIDPVDGDTDNNFGFKTSDGSKGCTLRAKCLDGFWLGDRSKQIRAIDTPGHGDPSGKDVPLRQSIVDCLRQERFVHAFLWFKNAESPRFDKQDREFYKIFTEMFGVGFMDNLIVVLTRFSYSQDAEYRRQRKKSSLDVIVKGIRTQLMDDGEAIPIFAIDTLHNPNNTTEAREYAKGMSLLWTAIETLGAAPVENIKMVQDDLGRLESQVTLITTELENSRKQHSQQMEQMLEEQRRAAAAYEEEKNGLQEKLSSLVNMQQEMHNRQEESSQTIKEYMDQKSELEKELREVERRQREAFQQQQEEFVKQQRLHEEERQKMNAANEAARAKQAELEAKLAEALRRQKDHDAGGGCTVL